MTDFELLKRYSAHRSEEAFRTLVERYANLVFSSAARQTGDPHTAEEIAQAVFIILARKAGILNRRTILSGWLLRTTRFVALNARRRELRRLQAESEAAALYEPETDAAWSQLKTVLDEALAGLSSSDRNAVTLRFLEQKRFKEIATIMGTTEDAAQKKVSRALERLRTKLGKCGVVLPGAIVAGALSARAVQAAPVELLGQLARLGTDSAAGAASVSHLAAISLARLKAARVREIAVQGTLVVVFLILLLFVGNGVRKWSQAGQTAAVGNVAGTPISSPSRPVTSTPAIQLMALGYLLLNVVDVQTGTPIAGARVTSVRDAGLPGSLTNRFVTDGAGRCDVPFGPEPGEEEWHFRIEVLKDGHVPKFVSWAATRGDVFEELPASYTVKLERGTVISGLVLDESGGPVSGACVTLNVEGPWTTTGVAAEREGLAVTHMEMTDEKGHWLCNHAAAQFDSLRLLISHTDYPMSTFECARFHATTNLGVAYLDEAELRSGSAVTRLKRGLAIGGVVTDEEDKPIAGARLTEEHRWSAPDANCQTGADGRFHFGNAPETGLALTVRADGFQSADVMAPANTNGPLRIRLAKAVTLRGRVLGEDANAIPYARIAFSCTNLAREPVYWDAWTDGEGRFAWPSAPPVPVLCTISAAAFVMQTNLELRSDGLEHEFRLQPTVRSRPLRIAGTVTDAESGGLIPDFKVLVGSILERNLVPGDTARITLAPELRTTGRDGRFSFLIPPESLKELDQLNVEISVGGYASARESITRAFIMNRELRFNLKSVPSLAGVVQLPNGDPAVGAVIMLYSATGNGGEAERVFMQLPGQLDLRLSRGSHLESDVDGKFKLPNAPPESTLFAAHKEGFVTLRLNQLDPSHCIKLEPWGRVAGSLRIRSSPGAKKQILLNNSAAGEQLQVTLWATTDDDGNFSIDGVPPGEWKLFPHSEHVKVRAGETSVVNLGGGGRKLIGKLKGSGDNGALAYSDYRVMLNSKWFPTSAPRRSEFADPAAYASIKNEWLRRREQFGQSEAGREAGQKTREYNTVPQTDGTFAIDEVLPGTYELRILGDPLKVNPSQMAKLDELTQEITIPGSKEPGDTVDVGVLDLEMKP
jgi:RNA polymerase sigma factor (sigma-70 family)